MKAVNILIDELIEREGGYANHPSDRGGATMYGITEHVARAYGYIGGMQSLPKTTAGTIYALQYWTGPKFSEVGKVMPNLAVEMFDTGVNMGPKVAATFLQRALNLLNRGGKDYPDIIADGDIGRMTLYSLAQLANKRGTKDAEKILLRLCDAQQAVHYMGIAEKNPTQEDFMPGWILNRVGVED